MLRGLVLVIAFSGCGLGETCKPHTWRCAGDELETCTPHGGGVYGIPPMHVDSSDPTWDGAASCGANQCIDGTGDQRAFCAIAAAPDPACGVDGYACDGTTRVTCRAGYAIEREACASCAAGACAGALYAVCQDVTDCAIGMTCTNHTCEQPCGCADGTDCAACHAVDERSPDPDNGAAPPYTCSAGTCRS